MSEEERARMQQKMGQLVARLKANLAATALPTEPSAPLPPVDRTVLEQRQERSPNWWLHKRRTIG
jgi:hypothetical protein